MPETGYSKVVHMIKDEGQKDFRVESYPYGDIARDAWKGTMQVSDQLISTIVIPAGMQLKLLFLRVWSEYAGSSIFKIVQVNPTAAEQTGAVEAFPVKGSVPAGTIDYPMLEAAGAEVIGPEPLASPIHVLEGSVTFEIQDPTPTLASDSKFGIAWWGKVD